MKKLLKYLVFALLGLIGTLLFNTFTYKSKQTKVTEIAIPELPASALSHFQDAIKFKTISFSYDQAPDSVEFTGFRKFLERTYPLTHQKLNVERISYSLLYHWKGKNASLKPVILMAHQDVVPIEPATKNMWTVDPFAGVVKDGFIWGRGTTDDKINLISILESTEKLLLNGFTPERDIYLIFGHDEEVAGRNGAVPIANLLVKRGVQAEFILDEGGMVTQGKLPGISNAALIATAEKGYMSVEMEVNINGGHSSYPAEETALDVLLKAVRNIRENQMPIKITEATQDFFDNIGPEMPFLQKMVFANQWLTKPILINSFNKDPKTAAMLHTTTVPTMMNVGIKDNVIPTVAKATVNFRILPGESSDEVLKHVSKVINDKRVIIKTIGTVSEPSNVTDDKSYGFQHVATTAKQNFGGTTTTPFLLIGATDSRHFVKVSKDIIKFSPMIDPIGFHAIDERVSLESYRRSLSFFENLIRGLR